MDSMWPSFLLIYVFAYQWLCTVDREIFALKIIRVKIFRVDKFSRFRSIPEIFLTVDDCNMDERLESLWLLVYYQVSGEPGIARCSHQSDIYLGECGLARKLIHWSSLRNLFFTCLIFAVGLDREINLTGKFSRSSMWTSFLLILACLLIRDIAWQCAHVSF